MASRFVTVRRPRSVGVWTAPFGTVPGETAIAEAVWTATRRLRLSADRAATVATFERSLGVYEAELPALLEQPLEDLFLAGWENGRIVKARGRDGRAERFMRRMSAKVAAVQVANTMRSMDRTVGAMRGAGVPEWRIADHLAVTAGLPERYAVAALNRFTSTWERLGIEQPNISPERRAEASLGSVRDAMRRATATHLQTVSRTVAMQATNEGRLESWLDLDAEGLIVGHPVKRWKVADGDADSQCLALEGMELELQDFFDGAVLTPPIHANCRCEVQLVVRT